MDGTVCAFSKPSNRIIAVERQDQRAALLRCGIEQAHVTPMQKVIHAIGKNQWPRASGCKILELGGLKDFRFKARRLYQDGRLNRGLVLCDSD